MGAALSIDFAAVADFYNTDNELFVLDFVDDAIDALAEAIALLTRIQIREFRWSWPVFSCF